MCVCVEKKSWGRQVEGGRNLEQKARADGDGDGGFLLDQVLWWVRGTEGD